MTITISFTNLKRFLYVFVFGAAVAALGISFALAQSEVRDEDLNQEALAKIEFPITELGGCANKQECKQYCDAPENRQACFSFAKRHQLMKPEKIRKIEKRMQALEVAGGGPGGCQSEQECKAYCSDVSRMRECIEFAKAHGVMDKRELEEAEKIQAALDRGLQLPGGCTNRSSCEVYCENPSNIDECVAFAEQAGFMDAEELAEMKRVLPLMKRGETPGGCRTRETCETYCDNPDHLDECIAFAEKAGLADPKELEIMKKTGGRGPGGCRGKVECEAYCNALENMEECFNFGAEHGLISPEEIEQIRKIGGPAALKQGGPGGCQGKRECDAYCKNPRHQDECFRFASEKGLIPPEEVERINALGGPGAFSGPGGCVGPRECERYCLQEGHFEECAAFFAPPGGEGGKFRKGPPSEEFEEEFEDEFEGNDQARRGPPPFVIPGFAGPGGCKTPEECVELCSDPRNLPVCEGFTIEMPPPSGDHFEEFPGEGFPTAEFAPPPGFGEGAPPHREEGFEVPPGFVPPGVDRIHEDIEDARQEGDFERVEKLERFLENPEFELEFERRDFEKGVSGDERLRREFETRQREEGVELRVRKEFELNEEEARRRVTEEFRERVGDFDEIRREERIFEDIPEAHDVIPSDIRPPEFEEFGDFVPQGPPLIPTFNLPPTPQDSQQEPGEFGPPAPGGSLPEGQFHEERTESRPLSLLRKVVTVLLLFGL